MATTRETGAAPGQPLAHADWLRAPALVKVFRALEAEGGTARVVGGAVRNALIDEPITDIDIATPILPADVSRLAASAGLAVHPTGIEHGTVTVVADGHAFEVTTLRRDVETDGRRAVVAFSTDWREDAGRRDFTFNALYADRDGTVFDFFGGLDDLAAKRVRFIGDAEQRIREDYLRILRFFRFNAQYGNGAHDETGLAACTALKAGITRLSSERIGAEMMKLLKAPRAPDVVSIMAETSVLHAVLGPGLHPERLTRLAAIETANGFAPDPLTRLAALVLDGAQAASHLAQRLRLANAEAAALAGAATLSSAYDPATPERVARAWLYSVGAENFSRAARVAWAAASTNPTDQKRKNRALLPGRWPIPELPVRGADLVALGIPPGPRVGAILKAFENWWISADFPADPALHNNKLTELAANSY